MNIMKHNYLQNGQIGVFVEEASWNICDLVDAQNPRRK